MAEDSERVIKSKKKREGQLLEQQSKWTRKYAPAVEHACASTVVDANPPDMIRNCGSLAKVWRKKLVF